MRNKVYKKLLSVSIAATIMLTSGCGVNTMVNDDVRNYPLSKSLTKQELVDFYAKSLDYDNVVSRNIKVHKTTYETKEITGEKANRLKELVGKAQEILSNDDYLLINDEGYEEATKIISPDTFYSLKTTIDNYKLTDGKILDVTGALGYYFVDTEFTETPRTAGQFNQRTSLLGINGIFKQDPITQVYSIDENLLEMLVIKLNRYYFDNGIVRNASYDTGIFKIEDGVPPVVKATTDDGSQFADVMKEEDSNMKDFSDEALQEGDKTSSAEQVTDEEQALETPRQAELITEEQAETVEEQAETVEEQTENTEEQADLLTESVSDNSTSALVKDEDEVAIISDIRQIQFDVNEINSIVGSTASSILYPELNDIYIKPEPEGDISGYGIYPAGAGGLRLFGLDREQLEGKIKIRFVFKDAVDGSGDLIGTNAYVFEEQLTRGISDSSQDINIPRVLMSKLEQIVDRSDRVIANNDLASLMSGNIYTDMGVGVLRGFENKTKGVEKYMSKIRQVLSRDEKDNTYLLDVENTTTEGARDADCYGTYKDKYYIVVQQDGAEFRIIDKLRVSREVVDEPPINLDSSVLKSLVAIGLSGEVSDTNKENINKLLSDLYLACTDQILEAFDKDGNQIEYTINGDEENKKTYDRGLADCFDSDVTLLSSDDKDYIISTLKNLMTKYGNSVDSIYGGVITEWLGGYDNQVELTTEELVYYPARGTGHRMEVYYLISNMNDKWVIDERKVLDEEDIDGELLNTAVSRIMPGATDK